MTPPKRKPGRGKKVAAAKKPRQRGGMRTFLALLVASGLAALVFLCPFDGKTLWARAEAEGLPRAAAKATAHGARSVWSWIEGFGHSDPAAAPAKPPRKRVARAGGSRGNQVPAGAPEAEATPETATPKAAAAAPLQAPAGPDGVVPAPAREHLGDADRRALDNLLRAKR